MTKIMNNRKKKKGKKNQRLTVCKCFHSYPFYVDNLTTRSTNDSFQDKNDCSLFSTSVKPLESCCFHILVSENQRVN